MNKMVKRERFGLAFFIFYIFWGSALCAQKTITFSQISTKEGLSQNTVRSILVDNKGFLWVGTLDGLVRYDGNRFITHKPDANVANNIPDQRVKGIFEDDNGFIWILTYANSFSCYNPNDETFIEFSYEDRNIPLPYTHFKQTSDGAVWLWGGKGCVKLILGEKNIPEVVFHSSYTEEPFTNENVYFLFEDSSSNIWIGTETDINKIDSKGQIEQFFKNDTNGIFGQAIEDNGIVYFLTSSGTIYRYSTTRKSFLAPFRSPVDDTFLDLKRMNKQYLVVSTLNEELYKVDIESGAYLKNAFNLKQGFKGAPQFVVDERDGLWVYDYSGRVFYYNSLKDEVKQFQLIKPEVANVIDDGRFNILIDAEGIYWITTYGNGLYRYDVENDQLRNYSYDPLENSPASDYLLSIVDDQYGNIWIGSEYAGVIKVVKKKYHTEYIRPEKSGSIGTKNNVRIIYQDSDSNIWLGTKNGSLYLYDSQMNFKRVVEKNINPYTVCEDDKGRIWVGTKGNGIYVIDKKTFKHYRHFTANETDDASISHNSIFDIIQDSEKRIWIASFGGGIDLVEEANGRIKFKNFLSGKGNVSYVRCLIQDKEGKIWAGSYDGLISFTYDEIIINPNAYTIYSYNTGHPVGLNCNDIKTIYEDSSGQLWVGTAGGGLNLFDRYSPDRQGAFIKYTKKEGLPSDIVTSILESEDGVIWVGTENGLAQFDQETKTFLTYYFSNSSYGNFYGENACLRNNNGDLLWGTLDGLLVFAPGELDSDNKDVPQVQLTDLFVFDQRIEKKQNKSPLKESISNADEVILTSEQRTFSLYFACLDLTDPKRNKYSYKLEPYDQFWSKPNSNNWATYKNMPAGKYTFKVKGANADGIWNNEVTTCQITVLPTFWRSIYAIIIYVTVIALLGLIFVRFLFRINKLNSAVKMEKQLTDYKLRFFTNVSHEFRTPLTLIKGALESINDQKDLSPVVMRHLGLLNRNTQHMSRLIDQLLEFRKLQNNILTLNLEKTEINEYALNVYYEFKEIAFQKEIDYQFEGLDDKWYFYVDRNKLEKILFNLLSNAFKFTPANGHIVFSLKKNENENKCVISVSDTGIGIPNEKKDMLFSRFKQVNFSAEGTGVGLELVKEFVEAHQGKVSYEPNEGGGSVFKVELPTNEELYKDVRYVNSKPTVENSDKILEQKVESDIKRPSSPSNSKLLIIDDNYDIREYLSEELKHHFNIELAVDGKDGLEKAIAINPALIICDVKMPEMDGLEVTRRLKENFETSHIPIILLTAMSSDTIKLQGSESGADAYIMKPFSLKYLLSRIYGLIDQREKLKKRFSVDIDVKIGALSEEKKDKEFYTLINDIVDQHLADANFTVTEFTELAGLSRTIFYKKVKGLTGYSPNELIKIKRMKKAAELLVERKHTVSEVSWQVGIEDPFYFSKCFKAQFGCAPSKFGIEDLKTAKANEMKSSKK
ncbi:hybrid sensor histidine kinase/response regulator [Carboxylicivirga linearis]|uniref:histidine kinase n=1 Tax=Carboxylicivirga linearis TaxID=1628157 RepID=A0ABS5JTE5_9BACT|nr:two-component regulator propeller domain-containing protein [Carboxylicivirga linearis]MBS2098075.1 response regulator [Carboxylicivirga linearis]